MCKIDSEVLAHIPENIRSFLTSEFREDEINEIWSGEQRMQVEILSKSCELLIEIKRAAF